MVRIDLINVCSIHRVDYYSAIKKDEALTPATTWTNPEHILLRERNQTQKPTGVILFIWKDQSRQIDRHRLDERLPGAGDGEQ